MAYTEIKLAPPGEFAANSHEMTIGAQGYHEGIKIEFDPDTGNIRVYNRKYNNIIFQEINGKKEWLPPADKNNTNKNGFEALFRQAVDKVKENNKNITTPLFVRALHGETPVGVGTTSTVSDTVEKVDTGIKDNQNGWEFVGSDLTKWTISKLMEHGPLHYPIDAMYSTSPKSTVNQDHIRILQYTYRAPSSFILGQDSDSNLSTGLSQGMPRRSPLKEYLGLVKLPMPTNISDSNNVNWGEDRMNQLTAAMTASVMGNKVGSAIGVGAGSAIAGGPGALIGLLLSAGMGDAEIKKAFTGSNFQGGLNALTKGMDQILNGSNPQGMILGTAMSSKILAMGGFEVDPNAILSRGAGVAPQSNLELLFQSPALRTFDFAWKMTPRSEREARITKNIVRFFKQGMAARKEEGLAGGPSIFLGAPNIFQVQYKTNNNQDIEALNRIKTCACTGCAVNYTPDGVWSAYEKGQPVSTVMSLRFAELEPIYDTDYQEAIEEGREWEEPGWSNRSESGDLYPIGIDEVGY